MAIVRIGKNKEKLRLMGCKYSTKNKINEIKLNCIMITTNK